MSIHRPQGAGPLAGIRIIELEAMGPVPHAARLFADLGADVVLVSRPGGRRSPGRGRARVELDLKSDHGRAQFLSLVRRADVLLEGFRPGVMERLRLAPDECTAVNERLVYGRMTGWGQEGPLAHTAGHDINYLALTGVLNAIGRPGEPPVVPLNLIGDYGGGSMYLVVGVLTALLARHATGRGDVLDVAIVDGVCSLTQPIWALRAAGRWSDERGSNRLDSGAPFYDVYETADGKYMAVGALEPAFYAQLLEGLGLCASQLPSQDDRTRWPELRARFAAVFATRTRDEWTTRFTDRDACVTPVLSFDEVGAHPHIAARASIANVSGAPEPVPAPRFADVRRPVPPPTATTTLDDVLSGWRMR